MMAAPPMEHETPPPDILSLGPVGRILRSQRTAVFESLIIARRGGLTIPQIVTSSGVPTATVHRIIKEFQETGLILVVGKDGKAPVYGLNPKSRASVEVARTFMDHARRIAAMKSGMADHGGDTPPGEHSLLTVEISSRREVARKRPSVSIDIEAES